jgi:hypothetical protein
LRNDFHLESGASHRETGNIRAFKSQYPDSDIELAQPMIMARGYGDNAGLDYVQLVDSDVFEDDEIVLADWWGPYELWKNDLPQGRATA